MPFHTLFCKLFNQNQVDKLDEHPHMVSRLAWISPFQERSLSPDNTPAGEIVSVLVLQMRKLHAEMKATQLVMVGSGPEYDPGLHFSRPPSAAVGPPNLYTFLPSCLVPKILITSSLPTGYCVAYKRAIWEGNLTTTHYIYSVNSDCWSRME